MAPSIVDRFVVGVVRFRWMVIIAAIVASAAASNGVTKLEFISHYRIFFGEQNPDLKKWDEFQATFARNDNVNFILQLPEGNAFDKRMAVIVEGLTERAWTIPNASRVDSISNFQHTTGDEEGLIVTDLVERADALTPAELKSRGEYSISEPALYKYMVSEDMRTTAVNVTINFQENDAEGLKNTVAAAREIAADLRAEHPDLRVALTGVAMFNNAFNESGERDGATLVPIMYGAVVLLTLLLLRSFVGTLATLATIILSTFVALGLAGHLGMSLAPITIIAPNIILTLAVADCIHIISAVQRNLRNGLEKFDAIRIGLKKNFTALFVTSATTTAGFLSLNYSDAPPFQYLGNITALGVLAAWILAITLVPALLAVFPLKPTAEPKPGLLDKPLARFAEFAIAFRGRILIVGTVASIALVGLAFTNDLDDRFSRYFSEDLQIRQDNDFSTANIRGNDYQEFSFESGRPGGVSDPEYLQTLDNLMSWLRVQPEVQHVSSFSDTIKRLNQNMNNDDPVFYKIPEDAELSAQYLLLYELSLPYGLDLNDRINIDKSASRVTISLHDMRVSQQQAFTERMDAWLADNAPTHMAASPTGTSVIFGLLAQRNIDAMIVGNIIAVVSIAMMMMITLRSVSMGALSVVTNMVPALATFGFWAIAVGYIGMAASVIGAASLGIVVDYTVHFLTKYLNARREKHLSREDAIRYAFKEVGEALVYTSVIVGIGFAIIAYSSFQVNGQLGLLTAITVVVALIFDFLMLPALLLLGGRKSETSSSNIKDKGINDHALSAS